MSEALWEEGDHTTCACGGSWAKHCRHARCKWLKCVRKGCTGLFDLHTRRFWISKASLRKAS